MQFQLNGEKIVHIYQYLYIEYSNSNVTFQFFFPIIVSAANSGYSNISPISLYEALRNLFSDIFIQKCKNKFLQIQDIPRIC